MIRNALIFSIVLLSVQTVAQSVDYTLGIFFQPGISTRISTYENQELKEAFQTVEENERPDFSWEGGIAFHMYLSDYIHLESGLSLARKGYRALHTNDSLSFREPNDPVLKDLNEINASHEFYFVSVPFRIGFTIYQDREFAAGLRSGVYVDYHIKSIIRYQNIYYDHTENSVVRPEYEDLRKINVSGSLSIYGSYKLSDQYDIMLEPYCSITILPAFNDAAIKSRFVTTGLKASLHYRF